MNNKTVIVLGIQSNVPLATLQSLSRKGIRCIGISLRPGGVGLYSKHLEHGYTLRYRRENEEGFISELEEIAERHGASGILTHHELYMNVLNRYRERFASGGVKLLFPTNEVIDPLLDKNGFLERAEKLGVRVPQTRLVKSCADIEAAAKDFPFPAVMKISLNLDKALLAKKWQFKTRFFQDAEDFSSFCADFPEEMGQEFILQEFIIGEYISLGIAWQDGLVAAFQWRALREYEPGLGGYRISEEAHPKLVEQASKLCAEFNYNGVCEVEFRGKMDDPDNIAIMEINPRLWGGVSLPCHCGVDFPWLAYQIYDGQPADKVEQYRIGAYSRNLLGDVKWLYKVLSGKGVGGSNPNFSYQRLPALWQFISSLGRADVHDLENASDPRPFLMHYKQKLFGRPTH